MTTTDVAEVYHVGIVVPDIGEAMASLTELLGTRWDSVRLASVRVRAPGEDGEHLITMRVAFSVDPPHLELIEETPGTVWVCNPHSNLHHIGVWVKSLVAESERFVGARCPIQLMGAGDAAQEPKTFSYHTTPLGFRIELVDQALRPAVEAAWMAARETGA